MPRRGSTPVQGSQDEAPSGRDKAIKWGPTEAKFIELTAKYVEDRNELLPGERMVSNEARFTPFAEEIKAYAKANLPPHEAETYEKLTWRHVYNKKANMMSKAHFIMTEHKRERRGAPTGKAFTYEERAEWLDWEEANREWVHMDLWLKLLGTHQTLGFGSAGKIPEAT